MSVSHESAGQSGRESVSTKPGRLVCPELELPGQPVSVSDHLLQPELHELPGVPGGQTGPLNTPYCIAEASSPPMP